MIKLLFPHEFSLTLIYKAQGNIPYIKGRVYWDNKQREVQIGSIPNVISQIKKLCKDGLIPPIKGLGKKDIQWDYIKSTPEIESAIKYIGKIKFKQYVLKYFEFPLEERKLHDRPKIKAFDKISPIIVETTTDSKKISFDWYKNWRDLNE